MLFIGMAVILCTLGFLIGHIVNPEGGGQLGLILAVSIWLILSWITITGGSTLILRMSGAREVNRDVHPQLFNIVEEMKIASGLTVMPKIYIIDHKAPNAFATGMNPEKSSIAVTAGLLTRLNRDELQGVIAHEMSHILNRDVQFMTVSSIMLGSIVLISQVFLHGMWFTGGGSSRRYRTDKGGGGGGVHPALVVIAIVLAILGPIMARLMYFSISRKREYLADATAVRLTRYPEGLASALEKISGSGVKLDAANKVTAPMYIVNPLASHSQKLSAFESTHPPIGKRISILRNMSQGANFLQYQRAYSKAMGKPTTLIPTSGLKADEDITIREAHPDVVKAKTEKEQVRDVMDLMRAVNGYAFLLCTCGLKIKVPPEFEDPHIDCPRCGKDNEIPKAQIMDMAEAAAVVGAMVGVMNGGETDAIPMAKKISGSELGDDEAPLQYRRRTDGWESFSCACGNLLQLSPAFDAPQMSCHKCNRITRIN